MLRVHPLNEMKYSFLFGWTYMKILLTWILHKRVLSRRALLSLQHIDSDQHNPLFIRRATNCTWRETNFRLDLVLMFNWCF